MLWCKVTSCPMDDKTQVVKDESNKIGGASRNIADTMQCPVCKSRMFKSGQLKIKNPRSNRYNMVTVYRCRMCGYQTIG